MATIEHRIPGIPDVRPHHTTVLGDWSDSPVGIAGAIAQAVRYMHDNCEYFNPSVYIYDVPAEDRDYIEVITDKGNTAMIFNPWTETFYVNPATYLEA